MNIPTIGQALEAIGKLGAAATGAGPVVDLVIGLFKPADQQTLKDAYARQMGETDAALDRLEQAAKDAKAGEGR